MAIRIKRVYDPQAADDGFRVLVDRLWPRGVSKENAGVDLWLRDIAPSAELRKWFGHDETMWADFKRRYHEELSAHKEQVDQLARKAKEGNVTFLYGAKEEKFNNAAALKEYIEK
ncbi:MAG: DUF488 domain-containing protein [Chloroflexi bacterium]|nr:DUF488 domain-containing protein [Chloroflexota bacterium]